MSTRKLSTRTRRILRLIQQSVRERGFPPTMRELASLEGLASTQAVRLHLDALEIAGLIERTPEVARGIRLVRPASGRAAERNQEDAEN